MNITNPIARITAAIMLIISLLAVVGIFGEIPETGLAIIQTLIGAAITYLFAAQIGAVVKTG